MTTRPIREALDLLEMFSGDEKRAREAYDAAMEAVRAIENMAKTLAIQKTQDFFESLGVPTRLCAYGVEADAIDALVQQLQAHGMTALGEHGDVTLEMSRQVYVASL